MGRFQGLYVFIYNLHLYGRGERVSARERVRLRDTDVQQHSQVAKHIARAPRAPVGRGVGGRGGGCLCNGRHPSLRGWVRCGGESLMGAWMRGWVGRGGGGGGGGWGGMAATGDCDDRVICKFIYIYNYIYIIGGGAAGDCDDRVQGEAVLRGAAPPPPLSLHLYL